MQRNGEWPGTGEKSSFLFGHDNIERGQSSGCSPVILLDATRKGAFRAGQPGSMGEWDRNNRGDYSVAFGESTIAVGTGAFAHGQYLNVGGYWNTAFGERNVAGNYNSVKYNFVTGSCNSVGSMKCPQNVANNIVLGSNNSITAPYTGASSNLVAGCNNYVIDTDFSVIAGSANSISNAKQSLLVGRSNVVSNSSNSIWAGRSHSVGAGYGPQNTVTSGDSNEIGAAHLNGATIGSHLKNDAPGVVLVGRNAEANVNGQYNYSLQLGGGVNPKQAGVGLALQTVSAGIVPVQRGISTGGWFAGGLDYAEYFQWADGNIEGQDRVGFFVELSMDRITIAKKTSNVIGIVSGNPSFIGGAQELSWHGAQKRDDFGRPLVHKETDYSLLCEIALIHISEERDSGKISREESENLESRIVALERNRNFLNVLCDITPRCSSQLRSVPERTVNSSDENFDEERIGEYEPRSERREWSTVGLIGQIAVRQNGSCVAGSKCDCRDGYAIPGSTWRIMRVINRSVIVVLYTGNPADK